MIILICCVLGLVVSGLPGAVVGIAIGLAISD